MHPMIKNMINNVDSYKGTHHLQYPPDMQAGYSYIESRGGPSDEIVFFGLQMFIKDYLMSPITRHDLEEAASFWPRHIPGVQFNEQGFRHIINKHGGYMPLRIRSLPEGTIVPPHIVQTTVETTDPLCRWAHSYVETGLLRGIWYPSTVATISREAKKEIKAALDQTCDNPDAELPFKLHDFGARGASSLETAMIGGCAHLVNFMGSDTVSGVLAAIHYYNADMPAFSVPAAEHSTITAWGRGNEGDAYENMITQFAKPGAIVAVVSDSYDVYRAVSALWGDRLRQRVIDSGATIVIRPDSGDPTIVPVDIIEMLSQTYGFTVNSKGYRVLKHVRVIQGDGVNIDTIRQCLANLKARGFSAENIAFGMGGALLQKVDRDTFKYAMKESAVYRGGDWVDVNKDPVTDPGKASKLGRFSVVWNGGRLVNTRDGVPDEVDVLKTTYINGAHMNRSTFDQVRNRAAI